MAKILLMALALAACAKLTSQDTVQNKYENYGDIYAANGDSFVVSAATHPQGWGHTECFLCHNINNIHVIDRTKELTVDLAAVNAQIDSEGATSCFSCHGANGTDVQIPAPNVTSLTR